ncbi:MAG TPA: hypothetical protein VL131_13055 [Gammaproteobacteria bacterium]|nr:hypothetical protein [Gammaproteobacteria bacterium]
MQTKSLRKLTALALLPGVALGQQAEEQRNDWQMRAAIYAYTPHIGGAARFATAGAGEVDISANDLIDNTDVAFMGAFEAQKGRWGFFADSIYMDVGNSIVGSTTLGQGGVSLPPGVTADASLDIRATVLSLAANRRLHEGDRGTIDAFAGVRGIRANAALDATLSSPIGPIPAAADSVERTAWDAVVGVKGKVDFGKRGQWFVPYYVDIGTGDSDRTTQAATGIGYSFRWGEVFGTYRYLDYDFKSDSLLSDLEMKGPAIGVSFRF